MIATTSATICPATIFFSDCRFTNDGCRTRDPYAVFREQRLVLVYLFGKVFDENPHLILKSVVDLILRAADAKHVRREPRSAVVLKNLQDFLPLAEAIEEHRDCSEINGMSAEPEQMTRNAIQFGHDHANVLWARRLR